MYITSVPNRKSPPAVLLRESYREEGKVKNRTLANLSKLPPQTIEVFRRALQGGALPNELPEAFDVVRSLPHGHVAAVLGTLRRLGLHRLLSTRRSRQRDLCEALIASRIIETKPRSKLSTAATLRSQTARSTLGQVLGVQDADENELYTAMDWLLERQQSVESHLAKRHLCEGSLVLYDLTSTYFEGRTCPLAKLGYSRDGKTGTLQIVFGLLTNHEGCPVAVQVFEGNTSDPKTVSAQISKLRDRFHLKRIVMVGDRGMLTAARIREDLAPEEGYGWITALRAPAIRELVNAGSLQLSLFDQRNLAEITDASYPGERLVVCRNPHLADERRRKRIELLDATEATLVKVQAATRRTRAPLRDHTKIALRVGQVLNKFKMAKHFEIRVEDGTFTFRRRQGKIDAEAALDGIYVIRSQGVGADEADASQLVRHYKSLAVVERAFRRIKTIDLSVRPIHHRLADRVRAHIFLCMLAYYVDWHMRRALAPLLFHDEDRELVENQRLSVVDRAPRSESAKAKDRTKLTPGGLPVQSFRDLLDDLATLVRDVIRPREPKAPDFFKLTSPTPLQQRAFDLLGVLPQDL